MNIDINSYICPFLDTVLEQENVYPEMLWPFVDIYRSTQVTDVLFDIFCQLSATPSSHIGTLGELCRWGAGNGIEDSFLDFHRCYQHSTTAGRSIRSGSGSIAAAKTDRTPGSLSV